MNKKPYQQIIEKLSMILSKDQLLLLPKKWEKIGNVLILKLEKKLNFFEKDIAKTYAEVLSCKSVLKDTGGIIGSFREPQMSLIYGDKNTITIHQENSVQYKIDPAKIMFSSGNMDERKRMGNLDTTGEIIVDLFTGIGYFSLPIAVHGKPKKVYGCELNPIAFSFLKENIKLNKVSHLITPLFGDNREIAPYDVADRVLMGFFGNTQQFLPVAISCLHNHSGIIHYHDTFPDKKTPDIPFSYIEKIVKKYKRTAELIHLQKVKSFAPGISHYVLDVLISER